MFSAGTGMKDIQPLVQNRSVGTEASVGARRTGTVPASARLTNFYPLYGAANDQVDRVVPVRPVQFQRVIPRYRLSTSETRDQGVGPMFAGIPETPAVAPGRPEAAAGRAAWPEDRRRPAPAATSRAGGRSALREPWLGGLVDVLA
jgi:hypothetical protein